jgi:phage gp36-like protein
MADSTATYCTLGELQATLSAAGVNLRVDDDPAVYVEIIQEASSWLETYLMPHYTSADMAGNRWCKYACADLAVLLLSERRANAVPKTARRKAGRKLRMLERVALGQMQVPGLVRRRSSVPTVGVPRTTVGPYGTVTTIDRYRGTARRSPPRDYTPPRDILEPPYEPGTTGG